MIIKMSEHKYLIYTPVDKNENGITIKKKNYMGIWYMINLIFQIREMRPYD